MKNKFKIVFTTIIIIMIFIFGHQCGVDSVDVPNYKNDTIVKTDTIWPDTMKIEVPKPYPIKGDSILIEIPVEIPIDSVALKMFFNKRFYKQNYKDSGGVYTVEDTVIGYLLHQKLYYRSFKPLSIINSTVTTVKPLDTVKVFKKWEIRGGLSATPRNMFIDLEYQKNRISYDFGYDPFNKQAKVGLKYTIFKK